VIFPTKQSQKRGTLYLSNREEFELARFDKLNISMGEKAGSVFKSARSLFPRAVTPLKNRHRKSNIIDREILMRRFPSALRYFSLHSGHIAVAGFEFAESVFGEEFSERHAVK